MEKKIKRVGLRINEDIYKKYEELAQSYGMTVNSLMVFVLGQWISGAYDMQDKLIETMTKQLTELAVKGELKVKI